MDVGNNQALFGEPVGLFGSLRHTRIRQVLLGRVVVATRRDEGRAAVHHARAGLVPKPLDFLG